MSVTVDPQWAEGFAWGTAAGAALLLGVLVLFAWWTSR